MLANLWFLIPLALLSAVILWLFRLRRKREPQHDALAVLARESGGREMAHPSDWEKTNDVCVQTLSGGHPDRWFLFPSAEAGQLFVSACGVPTHSFPRREREFEL